MNIIKYSKESTNENITIKEDTIIYYENSNIKLNIMINENIRLFEYIDNSIIDNNYTINNNLIFDRFIINSSITTNLILNKENINIDYFFSCINKDDNIYKIDINHKHKNTKSKIVNHGMNMENNKLKFIINSIIPKQAKKACCLQDSKIIVMGENNCEIEPNLLVDNYDIEANHSAYIGTFDKEKIFYLETRGINKKRALFILAKSFLLNNREIDYSISNMIVDKIYDYWR